VLGVVEGNEVPYQPWAAAKKQENLEHWLERDPEIKCHMPGVPRATYMPYPFQILQGPNKILIAYTPVSPQHLMYEVTIEDPKVFTRPWKMSMPLYRRFEKDAQLLEYKCVEFVEQLMYGGLGVVDPATGQANK
jgi:hypothetical protein